MPNSMEKQGFSTLIHPKHLIHLLLSSPLCPTHQLRLASTSTLASPLLPALPSASSTLVTRPGCAPTNLPGFLALGAEAAHQLSRHRAASIPPVALEALERGRGHLIVQAVGEVAQDTDSILHALGGTGDTRVSSLGHLQGVSSCHRCSMAE